MTRFAEVDWHQRYNVAPTQIVETTISVNGEKRLGPMHWGFVSPTAKEPKLAPINARAETLSTSPMFRDAFRRHRCLVVADGFYEWRKNDGRRRTPFFVRLQSGRPFSIAGIWLMNHDLVRLPCRFKRRDHGGELRKSPTAFGQAAPTTTATRASCTSRGKKSPALRAVARDVRAVRQTRRRNVPFRVIRPDRRRRRTRGRSTAIGATPTMKSPIPTPKS